MHVRASDGRRLRTCVGRSQQADVCVVFRLVRVVDGIRRCDWDRRRRGCVGRSCHRSEFGNLRRRSMHHGRCFRLFPLPTRGRIRCLCHFHSVSHAHFPTGSVPRCPSLPSMSTRPWNLPGVPRTCGCMRWPPSRGKREGTVRRLPPWT